MRLAQGCDVHALSGKAVRALVCIFTMFDRVTFARLAMLPLACAAAWPVLAQPENSLLGTVVTATRNPQLISSTMPHTTVIDREDIERSQATDLVTLLQRETGLQRTQNGGVGTVSSVFMRGAPSLQTLVLIDGVPLNKQDASGAVSLEHLMLDNVERVEIVRGNVSAIYGSGAIGGVIQIFTRTGSTEPSARLTSEVGSRGTAKLSAQVSGKVGSTALNAGLSRYVTEGFSSINTAQFIGANPDEDTYQNTSVNVGLSHELAPGHRIGARFMRSDGNSDYDNAFGAPPDQQFSFTRLQQASVFGDNSWGDWRSRVTLSEQSDRSRTTDDGFFGSVDDFRTRSTVLNWTNNLVLRGDWLLTGGVERQRQSVDTGSTSAFVTPYRVSRHATAWFGGIEGGLGAGMLQLNLRHDKVGDLSKSTGFLGYSLPLGDAVKLIASASTSFNAPPLGYLFAPSYGNDALKPEEARSRELGIQFARGTHLLRSTWFMTRVTNQLEYDTSVSRFANIGQTRNRGMELSYQGSVGDTRLRAGLTLQDPENSLTGEALQRRATTLWSIGVSHPLGGLLLDADLRHSGKRPDRYTDTSTFAAMDTTLDAYTVLDFAASYRMRKNVELRVRIDNVTDKVYQTVYGYNQQPRSFYVGLSWRSRL